MFAFFFIVFNALSSCDVLKGEIKTYNDFIMMQTNRTYVISNDIDLRGLHFIMPSNDTLIFKRSKLSNGTLEGFNTVVISKKKQIFKNIAIIGTWNNKEVYSEWLDFSEQPFVDNRPHFENFMALCNGEEYTKAYMKKGCYYTSTKKNGAAILIPSNTHFIFDGKIIELANCFERTSLIRLYHVQNVVIDGGVYIGDVESHQGNTGEWSHGIYVCGSSNVIIRKVECNYFWGDGIDLIEAFDEKEQPVYNCNNIVIDKCKCYYNRRDGLGIEACCDCIVKNSIFSSNGKASYTPPGAGIGIEAWASNGEKIKNIRIENCIMQSNRGFSLQSYSNAILGDCYLKYKNDIEVVNCTLDDALINRTNSMIFNNCKFKVTPQSKNSYEIRFVNCSINNTKFDL